MTSTAHNLPAHKQTHLRSLLDSNAMEHLFEVIESMAFEHECKIVDMAMKSTKGYDAEAQAEVHLAAEHHAAVRILKQLQAQKEPFSVLTAKPSNASNP
jgi:hypothetical protein